MKNQDAFPKQESQKTKLRELMRKPLAKAAILGVAAISAGSGIAAGASNHERVKPDGDPTTRTAAETPPTATAAPEQTTSEQTASEQQPVEEEPAKQQKAPDEAPASPKPVLKSPETNTNQLSAEDEAATDSRGWVGGENNPDLTKPEDFKDDGSTEGAGEGAVVVEDGIPGPSDGDRIYPQEGVPFPPGADAQPLNRSGEGYNGEMPPAPSNGD